MPNPYFKFKKFTIFHDQCAMKVGTDGVLLGSWADGNEKPKTIIDIGSGTGLIALMLAQRFVEAKIDAVEIEANCAKQCKENVSASPYSERINVHNKSIQDFVANSSQKFDLLVSNPPFFIDAFTSANSQRNTARHNATLKQHDLWKTVTQISHLQSIFSVILPVTEGDLFLEKGNEYPWYLNKKCTVRGSAEARAKRVILEFSRVQSELEKSELVIEKQRGVYTEEFTALVKSFYLNL